MSSEQEIYEKKILKFEKIYGASEFSDIIRFTNSRIVNLDQKNAELMKQFDSNMELFSQQTVNEFKKLWAKLKEIEARIPGPVVTPPTPPTPTPTPKPKPEPPVVPPGQDKPDVPVKASRAK